MRKLIILEVFVEQGEVLDLGSFVLVPGNRIKDDGRALSPLVAVSTIVLGTNSLVLSDIGILASLGVYPREALIARVWLVLLIQTPADSLIVENIGNG